MAIRVYNTLTRKKEDFNTLKPNKVSMYVCGPTVYDNAHVGHAMSSMVFDIIRRYFEYSGYEVAHVMNYTDVDDKIIMRAWHEEIDPIELGERYINQYNQHLTDLNILPAAAYPRVSEEIQNIIDMVSSLIEKGFAYVSEGDVLFRVLADDDYGKLSRRKIEDMQAGFRIDVDKRKENPSDFALWKSAKEDEISWDSPWGKGRPGWHIECSTMCFHHLGEQIDIHGGGNDLVFPHHENEIAQTESFTGKPFASYWLHNGMMQLSGEKMSKSLGNLVTITEFLEDHDADVLRYMVLNSTYRGPLAFNDKVIDQAKKGLERLRNVFRPSFANAAGASEEVVSALKAQMEKTQKSFNTIMSDDFNTAGSLGQIFDLVRNINSARDAQANETQLLPAQDLVRTLTGVFGLQLEKSQVDKSTNADIFIDLILSVRNSLREEKLWALTDQVRDQLKELGVVIEDGKDGVSWRWE
jgi:cysteinyl-tRNA synthetase